MSQINVRERAIETVQSTLPIDEIDRAADIVDALLESRLLPPWAYEYQQRGFYDGDSPEPLTSAPGPIVRGEVKAKRCHRAVTTYSREAHGQWEPGDAR